MLIWLQIEFDIIYLYYFSIVYIIYFDNDKAFLVINKYKMANSD